MAMFSRSSLTPGAEKYTGSAAGYRAGHLLGNELAAAGLAAPTSLPAALLKTRL